MRSSLRLSRVATLALVLAVAVAAAGCASRAHRSATAGAGIGAPARQASTLVHTFRPAPTAAASTLRGSCWTNSITVSRGSAYRCLAHNQILDPCYAATRTARVAECYADPWSPPTRLLLTSPLPPKSDPLPDNRPWAIALAGGVRCVAATGTVQVVGNVALAYSCSNGGAAGLTPDIGRTRTAFYRAGPRADMHQVTVAEIWYG